MAIQNINSLSEDEEQILLFEWAQWQLGKYPELELMHHIPNGGARSKGEAGKFKGMGVKSGIPDIFLPCARRVWHGLYIELKRADGGKLSKKQEEIIPKLQQQGYKVVVCHGMEEAKNEIIKYLEG